MAFGLAAVALLGCVLFWPAWAESTFHSRLSVGWLAAWSGGVAFVLHPALNARLAKGVHEFGRGFREAMDDLDRRF